MVRERLGTPDLCGEALFVSINKEEQLVNTQCHSVWHVESR